MPLSKTRAAVIIRWIENYCLFPTGPNRGQRVKLTPAQKDTLRQIYDDGTPQRAPVSGLLAGYIALLHVAGPEAPGKKPLPVQLDVDVFTTWNATGPELREVLKRDAAIITCPELGTSFPQRAA